MSVDQKDETGRCGEDVKANLTTTHSVNNRKIRVKWIVADLQDKL